MQARSSVVYRVAGTADPSVVCSADFLAKRGARYQAPFDGVKRKTVRYPQNTASI